MTEFSRDFTNKFSWIFLSDCGKKNCKLKKSKLGNHEKFRKKV